MIAGGAASPTTLREILQTQGCSVRPAGAPFLVPVAVAVVGWGGGNGEWQQKPALL
jgi:hypothetical protein